MPGDLKKAFSHCQRNKLPEFQAEIEGIGVDSRNDYGDTFLTKSVEYKAKNIFDFILENGVDVNFPKSDGKAPLIVAAEKGDNYYVRNLLAKGADISALHHGVPALTWAIAAWDRGASADDLEKNKRLEVICFLLQQPDIDRSMLDLSNAKGETFFGLLEGLRGVDGARAEIIDEVVADKFSISAVVPRFPGVTARGEGLFK
jgi:ankyrin repeat protein